MMDEENFGQYLEPCKALAQQTGKILLNFWRSPNLSIVHKADGTPCTEADLAAHAEIAQGLEVIAPGIPILSEEGDWPDYAQRSQWRQYWLVDPLDGTRGFIAHLEQFSINIALIVNHQPVLGLIYVPALATFYYAGRNGGAFKQIGHQSPQLLRHIPKPADSPWRIVIGQYSQGKRLINLINQRCCYELLHLNGSLKFGWLAECQADVYPRLGPISEWDTAAGQCIIEESGGMVIDLQGRTLQYNCKDSLLNPEFIALADSRWAAEWLDILNGDDL